MALNNLPILFDGFRLMVTEPVAVKMREDNGQLVPVTNRAGEEQFSIVLFAKPKARPGERAGKGEEIKVTLPFAPAEEFEEGEYVELINPTVSYYEIEDRSTGRKNSGLAFKAETVKRFVREQRAA
ncbi:hypothetical protein [Umezawaea beigongshangensis]|uniref:hypothetical protein n=1 Tax=Umezawaea beigongshangensis TaxID=2780383 RepID=UPI0018F1DD1F|nr:hypothetical protein [Umezawaea beigongshangensis]